MSSSPLLRALLLGLAAGWLVAACGCVSSSHCVASLAGGDPEKTVDAADENQKTSPDSVVIPVSGETEPAPTSAAEWIGRTAPDFILLDSKGEKHQLSQVESDIVVLEWSSIVCSFVKRHYSRVTVQAMSRSYQQKGVTWFAIDSSLYPVAHPIKVEKWIEERRVPHPVLLDPEGIVGEAFSIEVTPTVVILKGGKVVFYGAFDDDIWGRKADAKKFVIEAIDALLAGEPIPEATPTTYGTRVHYLKAETARRAAREEAVRKRRLEDEKKRNEEKKLDEQG